VTTPPRLSPTSRRAARARAARPGFTLIEIMVAIIMLTVGLLAMASTTGAVSRQMRGANRQTVASTVAQSRFDSLTSVACANLVPLNGARSGSATRSGVTESWTITDGDDVVNIVDNVTFSGLRSPLPYTTVIPCRDSWQAP
jgi:type IV pilus assembly protein PilV